MAESDAGGGAGFLAPGVPAASAVEPPCSLNVEHFLLSVERRGVDNVQMLDVAYRPRTSKPSELFATATAMILFLLPSIFQSWSLHRIPPTPSLVSPVHWSLGNTLNYCV